jgi:hypothetical protein
MAFRKAALKAIRGFDPQFRIAGDDVDVCWRLQQRGWTLGFSPAAVVWHHRRNSIRTYLRQQWGYGKAEALLEEKWPEKYNATGHLIWAGRIYAPSASAPRRLRRIFHGVWGSALFQSVYQPAPGYIGSLPLMPEWYLVIGCLAAISAPMISWQPLLAAVLLVSALGVSAIRATASTLRVSFPTRHESCAVRFGLRALTALLYLLQPLARLHGRLRHGLSPWRRRRVQGWVWPRLHVWTIWSDRGRAHEDWLRLLEDDLRSTGARVVRGGDYDRWDLEVARGTFGSVRIMTVVEEHGASKQLGRIRLKARCSGWALSAMSMLTASALVMAWDGYVVASAILGALAAQFTVRTAGDLGAATAVALRVLNGAKRKIEEPFAEPQVQTEAAARAKAAGTRVA